MELGFDGGRFVSHPGELNYREVLEDFPNAKIIRILTYNISKNQRQDALSAFRQEENQNFEVRITPKSM